MRLQILAAAAAVCLSQTAAAQLGGGFNAPQPSGVVYPAFIGARGLVVAQVKGTNTWASYSKHSGVWRTHTFATDVEAIPVLDGGACIAFQTTGGKATELVAVDQQGNFRTHRLAEPSNKCVPVVGGGAAFYEIGNRVHAFSGLTGTWGSAESSPDTKERSVSLGEGTVMLLERDRIVMFSAKTGAWSASPPLAEPARPSTVGAN